MTGGNVARRGEFRGFGAVHGSEDPHGDIAGNSAAGYGRFRLIIIRNIIIFTLANSGETAPWGAARKTSGPAGLNLPGRDVET